MSTPAYTTEYDSDEDTFSVVEGDSVPVMRIAGPHRASDKQLCDLLAAALNESRVIILRSLQELGF